MTIKQKIKKWHIVVFIFLGIGGYWISQNMWMFEKQIPVEEYREYLSDSRWKNLNQDNIIEFKSNEKFYRYAIDNSKSDYYKEGTWNIVNDELNFFYTGRNQVVTYKVNFMTENYIEILAIYPAISSNFKLRLKKNNEK